MDNGLRLERVAGALNGIKVCLESGAAPGNISESYDDDNDDDDNDDDVYQRG